jgi:WD40 repeat protein
MGEFNIDTQNLKFHPLYEKDMNSISWNATGDTMLTTSDNQALLWKNNNWQQPAATYPMQQGVTWWAALSPDAQQVALVGDYFTVKIHPSGQPAYDLPGHKNSVLRAIFSPDGQQLATVSGDNTVKFWDLLQRSELFTINLPTNGKNAVWDFDFRCMSDKPTCWVAVPLSNSKQLALYELSQ